MWSLQTSLDDVDVTHLVPLASVHEFIVRQGKLRRVQDHRGRRCLRPSVNDRRLLVVCVKYGRRWLLVRFHVICLLGRVRHDFAVTLLRLCIVVLVVQRRQLRGRQHCRRVRRLRSCRHDGVLLNVKAKAAPRRGHGNGGGVHGGLDDGVLLSSELRLQHPCQIVAAAVLPVGLQLALQLVVQLPREIVLLAETRELGRLRLRRGIRLRFARRNTLRLARRGRLENRMREIADVVGRSHVLGVMTSSELVLQLCSEVTVDLPVRCLRVVRRLCLELAFQS
mmetsp:Transcript_48427/g.135282  ORF Transcript_48427/g.135282 Transcript_48427/m.135282 type:complete len:280 (+) Transcript_48427:766-1605(+)